MRPTDAECVERFLAEHRRASWGMVAYGGDEVAPLSAGVLAVPVNRLL